jgi:hypothetical protein
MKISVPMGSHPAGIHDGHRALIEYARSLGDEVIVPIIDVQATMKYIEKGVVPDISSDLNAQRQDIEKCNAIPITREIGPVNRAHFEKLRESYGRLVALYGDFLILERYKKLAFLSLVSAYINPVKADLVIRGPEIVSFFMRSVGKLLGWVDIRIFPGMIKDPGISVDCDRL